jgi:hypothetical protein
VGEIATFRVPRYVRFVTEWPMSGTKYVEAAVAAGLARDGGPGQLSDELVGQVAEAVRPVKQGLTVVKIGVLLERQGVAVPYRTLHRFCAERCGYGRAAATTVRVADGEPGMECQLDFGYLGLLADPVSGRQRKVHALIFTACYSRHMFVWLSFTQTLAAFLAGCEAAWAFFGGVFQVLVPGNASAIVAGAGAVNPRFTASWLDYMQARGFVTDAARVRSPKDKPQAAYCTSSGCSVRSSRSGWSALRAAAGLRAAGRVVRVGRVVEELSFVVISGAGDNSGAAPGFDGVVGDAVGGGGFGEGEHSGGAQPVAAAA